MKRNRIILLAISILAATSLLVSCKPTVPSQYIQPDEMADILYDYHLSQGLAQQPTKDEKDPSVLRVEYFQAVLKKHGITKADFDSSLVYYYSHVEDLSKIYNKVSDKIADIGQEYGASVAQGDEYMNYSATGDTANIWRGTMSSLLLPAAPYNRMDFEVPVDSTFKKGDSFLMNFMADFMYQSGTKEGVAYLAITYDNDSVASSYTNISGSGLSQLRVPACDNHSIRQIKGFLYLNRGNDESSTLKLMFVNKIRFIRFRKPKEQNPTEGVRPQGPHPIMRP